ncbi:MAG: methyltransferase domain-containing protein [Bacteroidota bacterium]
MKIEPQVLKYLKGDAFQTSLNVDIGKTKYKIISREAAINEMIKNQNIIHIGCSDHIQVIREKIRNNIWLHKLISDNAKNCIGIDIDKESIEFITKELGYRNVYYGNILTDDINIIREKKWDYVVFGEIIEHLDDPVNFLRVFKEKYGENVNRFIITVPSIYNLRQFTNMMNYREIINSDHRFWFTPYTIAKILVSAGYNPEKISYTNLQSLNIKELIIRKIKRIVGMNVKYPFYYFNTMVISGNLS